MRPFLVALSFLTRVPVPVATGNARDLGRATVHFPLVGVLLGSSLVGVAHLARGRVGVDLTAALLVILLALVTGGLHLDGVADVFDAAGGGRGDRNRMLEIMRDSRIGAHGAVALVLLLVVKVLAVRDVLGAGWDWPLLLAPAAARWAVVPLIVLFPPARTEGLGASFGSQSRPAHLAIATVLMGALLAIAGHRALTATAAALMGALAVAFWMNRRLGGLTGDVHGAAIEIAEVIFLVAAATRPVQTG